MSQMAEFQYINHAGGGCNERRTVADGTTFEQFFAEEMPDDERGRYNIMINDDLVTPNQVIRHGDVLSILPSKYAGGGLAEDLAEAARLTRELRTLPPGTVTDALGLADLLPDPTQARRLAAVLAFVRSSQGTTPTGITAAPSGAAAAPAERNSDIPPGHFKLAVGGGCATTERVRDGETITGLFARVKGPDKEMKDYRIRVRMPLGWTTVLPDYVIQEGNSVEIRRLDKIGVGR
jgi:hypothetical protein